MRKLRQAGGILLAIGAIVLIAHAFGADNATTVNSLQGTTPRKLGTFTLGALDNQNCPTGFVCNDFVVTSPGVIDPAQGVIADQKPPGPIKGLVVFFSPGPGTGWWQQTSTLVPPFFQSLLNAGFELVQIRWSTGWLMAPVGVQSGQELLACRPATAIKWVHDNLYAPLNLHPAVGQCGFCITGGSGGASQVTYPVASYGIDGIVDATIPTSGPPMASIQKGCLQQPGYGYSFDASNIIDESYGFQPATGGGPCVAQNKSFTNTWIANSVETGGVKYNYPSTRVHIIIGGLDDPIILNHATDYVNVLQQAQQQMLTLQVVPAMSHDVTDSSDGLSALTAALTGSSSPTPTPSPTPSPTATPTPTPSQPTADPILLPPPGTYFNANKYFFNVGIATVTATADINYTYDGSQPTGGAGGHGHIIPQNAGYDTYKANPNGITIKAIAYAPGQANSNVVSGLYQIFTSADTRTQVPAPQIGPVVASGGAATFHLGPTQKVMSFVLTTALPGAGMYYTLDGSTPTTSHGTLINQNVGRLDLSRVSGGQTQAFTVKVIGFFPGKTTSSVQTFNITLTN